MPACALALAAAIAGCGTTERSGDVGDTLEAEGIEVTVEKVDTAVPIPENDITGLSRPRSGYELVGLLVSVCSDNPAAIGPYDFNVETTDGETAALKFPQRNYPDSFESLRDDCDDGWVVLEVPEDSEPEKVTFGFEDSGQAGPAGGVGGDEGFAVKYSWTVSG